MMWVSMSSKFLLSLMWSEASVLVVNCSPWDRAGPPPRRLGQLVFTSRRWEKQCLVRPWPGTRDAAPHTATCLAGPPHKLPSPTSRPGTSQKPRGRETRSTASSSLIKTMNYSESLLLQSMMTRWNFDAGFTRQKKRKCDADSLEKELHSEIYYLSCNIWSLFGDFNQFWLSDV